MHAPSCPMQRCDLDQRHAQDRLQNRWLTLLEQGESKIVEHLDLKHTLQVVAPSQGQQLAGFLSLVCVWQIETFSGCLRYLTIASAWAWIAVRTDGFLASVGACFGFPRLRVGDWRSRLALPMVASDLIEMLC